MTTPAPRPQPQTEPLPPPGPPPPPPPTTAEVAAPAAKATLSAVPAAFDLAMPLIAATLATAGSWTDEFWAVCGYDKAATLAALEQLTVLAGIYADEYADDADVLR
jgi:hypothetical protein